MEQRKRETAYKLKIGEILSGTPIVEEMQNTETNQSRERFRFLELGDKKIVRVNIIANVVDKFNSEGEKKYATLTIDDATGQIRLKLFGEDILKFEEISQGDTIMVIGVLRSYNQEVYVSPEIVKKYDPRYLLVRKLELEKNAPKNNLEKSESGKTPELRDQIIGLIRLQENSDGISTSDIIIKITNAEPSAINSEIIKLIEDGLVYEPRPGKVRWLG